MSSKKLRIVVLVVAACCTAWTHSQLPNTTQVDRGADFVPRPHVAQMASFGFDALLADYYWLQAVQVVGAAYVIDEEIAGHLGKLIDVVTTLNPVVGHPYRFAAVWLTYSEEQVREANRLLTRSFEHHPDEWRNRFYLGFNHFFYLGEYEEAAAAIESAMTMTGSPAYLPRLVARLKSETSDIDVAEVFLRQLLETTRDEAQVAKIQGALDEIEIEYKARHLDRARDAYRELSGRDIESVEDLVSGKYRVLKELPSPEPEAIPEVLSRGSVWELDPDSNTIISSYLGNRYQIHYSGPDDHMFWKHRDEEAVTTATSEGEEGNRGGNSDEG